jgi:hypothetical protein
MDDMDRKSLFFEGRRIIMEFSPMDREDALQIPREVRALQVWESNFLAKDFSVDISKPEPKELINMTIEAAYLLGKASSELIHIPDYQDQRRDRVAHVINPEHLSSQTPLLYTPHHEVSVLLAQGESKSVEFKSSLRRNLHSNKNDDQIEHSVLKTIAAFQNTDGGTLLVGVSDDKKILGIGVDEFENEDKMRLHLVNLVSSRMGVMAGICLQTDFQDYEGKRVLRITCAQSKRPIYIKEQNRTMFYVRVESSTRELRIDEVHRYIQHKWPQLA